MMNLMLLTCACLVTAVCAAEPMRARTPTPLMGSNSWNWFGKQNVNEQIVREVIDDMATNGLREVGYTNVVGLGAFSADLRLLANTKGQEGSLIPTAFSISRTDSKV